VPGHPRDSHRRDFEQERNATVTSEVGSEGGSPGDVGLTRKPDVSTGSEAGETHAPAAGRPATITRDETGEGRRSP
jgi:hypothetical protein